MTHNSKNNRWGRRLAGAASLLIAAGAWAASSAAASADPGLLCSAGAPAFGLSTSGVSAGWIADEADNVCGVRSARQITHPASIKYSELLDATPEVQRMKRDGISRDSAQGQVLYAAAVDRVTQAARRVMNSNSYCSVWKQVRHQDGRSVPDVSSEVKAEL